MKVSRLGGVENILRCEIDFGSSGARTASRCRAWASFTQVGRPWLHWPERGVTSISRSSAFISATDRIRPARTEPWQAIVAATWSSRSRSASAVPSSASSAARSRAGPGRRSCRAAPGWRGPASRSGRSARSRGPARRARPSRLRAGRSRARPARPRRGSAAPGARPRRRRRRRAHPLEHQPLVRGMLVDDHQPVLGLGDDIGRGDLAARDAERDRLGTGAVARLRRGRRAGRAEVASRSSVTPGEGRARQRLARRPAKTARIPAFAGMTRGSDSPVHATGAANCSRAALRWPASSSASRRPPTISPRTAAGSRKRTSVLAGWTLTSTSLGRHARRTAPRPGGGRGRAGRDRRRAARRPAAGPSPGGALTNRYCWSAMPRLKVGRLTTPVRPQPVADAVDADAVAVELAVEQRGDPRRRVRRLDRQRRGGRHGRALKPTSGRAIASRCTASRQAAYSARGERRNLRRAGTLSNRPSTRTRVPGGSAAGPSPAGAPWSTSIRQPSAPRDAAFERQPGDAGDRRQRLAAKAEAGHVLDRVVGQLGGGVALEREAHLGRASCRSRRRSPRSGRARPRRAGPRRCVAPASSAFSTSSFKRAGRPLDHLARGDAIDEFGRQPSY